MCKFCDKLDITKFGIHYKDSTADLYVNSNDEPVPKANRFHFCPSCGKGLVEEVSGYNSKASLDVIEDMMKSDVIRVGDLISADIVRSNDSLWIYADEGYSDLKIVYSDKVQYLPKKYFDYEILRIVTTPINEEIDINLITVIVKGEK